MTSPARPRGTRRAWPIVVVAVAIALVCAFAVWRPSAPAPSAQIAAAAGASAVVEAEPLLLPAHPGVLIFGDSWTYGAAASDPTLGYAYVIGTNLGWDAIVDGVPGSGYLKPGRTGPAFGERVGALDPALDPDLVIVQGSINDRAMGEAGYRSAVTAAWDALEALYPDASFVILGPAPHVLPVGAATARIDRDLGELASGRGWFYISPIGEQWITEANYLDVIDTGVGRNHPSTAGHAYLATRLAEGLAARTATSDAAAELPVPGT